MSNILERKIFEKGSLLKNASLVGQVFLLFQGMFWVVALLHPVIN